jgi:hypothetical protein
MKVKFFSLALFLAFAPAMSAQGRPARSIGVLNGVIHSVSVTGEVALPGATATAQTGVNVPGGSTGFNTDSVVVCGRTSGGDGILEHWKSVAGSATLQSSTSSSGFDFVGVTYDATNGALYALDLTTKTIWKASWNGSASLPSFPAGWAAWATTTQVAWLNDAASLYLDSIPGTGKVYLNLYPDYDSLQGQVVYSSGGTLHVDDYGISNLALVPTVIADQLTASEAGTTIFAHAPPSTSVQVVDVDSNTVLGSATVPSNAEGVTVSLSSALVIGRQYAARATGSSTWGECAFRAMRRYGFPETMSDGTTLRGIPYPESARIGNADFNVAVGINKDPAPSSDGTFTAYLGFALRTTSGDPITTASNGNKVLVTSTFLATSSWISAANGQGIIYGGFGIPNDPSLVGVVGLFQFWIADSTVWRLSEIVGIELGAVDEASSFMAGGGGGGSSSLLQAASWMSLSISRGQMFFDPTLCQRILNSRQ